MSEDYFNVLLQRLVGSFVFNPRIRHRRDGISLALKAGLVSTPRSMSPNPQEVDDQISSIPKDQDSFIYAFLEEALKKDKKKHRHSRRHEDHHVSRDRDASRDRRHHHRKHKDCGREREKSAKEETPAVDQAALFETFAKLCAKMNEKTAQYANVNQVPRSHSHKSLQCEVESRRDLLEQNLRPVRPHSRDRSRDRYSPSRIRSHEHFNNRNRSHDNIAVLTDDRKEKCACCDPYDKTKYTSKMNVPAKNYEDERYRVYPPEGTPTRTCINGKYRSGPERRDIRTFDERPIRKYDDRRPCEHKASRSFEMHRDKYNEDDRSFRRTARSDGIKDKNYEQDYRDSRYDVRHNRDKYYDDKDVPERNYATLAKDRRSKRNLEKFERISIASRDEDYRDRYSERERDSGLSVADGETSTISGRSNYLRVVKQEISEQREAMDKMMKLWKELMRCFKGISQTQGSNKTANEQSAANVRESAAEQLRLWRECMHRYETVARDVGDTDARLMEEINKQRSEMTEMANMWQECLQRYRDMSNDFNNLKQQLATSESPTRAAAPPPVCAEGEGPPAAPYRLPPTYPPVPQMPAYMGGSPLRSRASAPPAWWWSGEGHHSPPRRRSSPESRGSRERRHRHKDRDRDESRYKEKSKPSGARSEHRRRKR